MKLIRRSVFETNSSSTHSISFVPDGVLKFPESVTLTFGEFGWEEETHYDVQTKLTYVMTALQYYVSTPKYPSCPDGMSWTDWENSEEKKQYNVDYEKAILESIYILWLRELLNDVGVIVHENLCGPDKYSRFGYIDHQSVDTLDGIWSDDEVTFKNNMKNFIFNPNCYLRTDNDNH